MHKKLSVLYNILTQLVSLVDIVIGDYDYAFD